MRMNNVQHFCLLEADLMLEVGQFTELRRFHIVTLGLDRNWRPTLSWRG